MPKLWRFTQCSKWQCAKKIEETNFLKFKCENRLSFSEARKSYRTSNNSYAKITQPKEDHSQFISRDELNKSLLDIKTNFENTIVNALKEQANTLYQMFSSMIQQFLLSSTPTLPEPSSKSKDPPPSSPERKKTRSIPNIPRIPAPSNMPTTSSFTALTNTPTTSSFTVQSNTLPTSTFVASLDDKTKQKKYDNLSKRRGLDSPDPDNSSS